MPKTGDVINVPARVLHVMQADGKTTLVLQRITPVEPKGSTDGGDDGGGYAVMWGS